MNNEHLTDESIQEYVFNRTDSDPVMQEHMGGCEYCKQRAADYELLFSAIGSMPIQRFDFNLAELVVSKISTRNGPSFRTILILSIVALVFISLPIYFFNEYFLEIISGVSLLVIYLIVTAVIMILIFQILEEYRKYIRRINSLDF
jgi:hypothetical protein